MKKTFIFEKRCAECLFSDARIVSEGRKNEIERECLNGGKYFICHKSSLYGDGETMCKGWFDKHIPQDSITKLCFDIGKYELTKLPDNETKSKSNSEP